MANDNPKTDHLKDTQWQSGVSGNPSGKPKGSKHLSTWIKEMMEDDSFECKLKDGTLLKCAPVKAIVKTMICKAVDGDIRAFDAISKYGYGTRPEVMSETTMPVPILGGLSCYNPLENLVIVKNNSELSDNPYGE